MDAMLLSETGARERDRIVIGLVEHMGDIVACEPVARYVKLNNPDAHLSWVLLPQFRELLDTNPFVDDVVTVDCVTDWMKLSSHGSYAQVIDLHVNYRVCGHCQIPLVKRTGNPFVTAFEWFDYGAILEAFSVGAGLPKLSAQPRLYLQPSHASAVDALALPPAYCVIHRRSTEVAKDWTDEGWPILCSLLRDHFGLAVVEVGAGKAASLSAPIEGVTNLVNRLTILETAEVIRRARLFIGIDSGPAHLANAQQVPGVVLLGKYKLFEQYMPFTGFYASAAPTVKMLRNRLGPVADLTPAEVWDAVKYAMMAVNDLPVPPPLRAAFPASVPSWAPPREPGSHAIDASGLFDVGWYAVHHPEVLDGPVHPIDHYLREGAAQNFSPTPEIKLGPKPDGKASETGTTSRANPLLERIALARDVRYDELLEASYGEAAAAEVRHVARSKGALSTVLEHGGAAVGAPPPRPAGFPKTFAFYLPQFHPIAENDWAHEPGFSEWHNVIKAKPLFRGHDQPRVPGELGFYDLRSEEVLRRQIQLAQAHGIDGFCFYYYYFAGRKLLNKPLDNFVRSDIDAPFLCLWANENWTKRWDGGDREVIIAQHHSDEDDILVLRELAELFRDRRYTTVTGKPVLMVYKTHLFPDIRKTAEIWRAEILRLGFPGLYLVMVDDWTGDPVHPRELGFDASYEIPSNIVPRETLKDDVSELNLVPEFAGRVVDYVKFANFHLSRPFPRYRRFRTVMLPWDNTPRYATRAMVQVDGLNDSYRTWLTGALLDTCREYPEGERFVFLHSWNEWCEGTYLEPDQKRGRFFLEQTRLAVELARQAVGHGDRDDPSTMAAELLKVQNAKDVGSYHVMAATRTQTHHVWRDLLRARNETLRMREEADGLRQLLHLSEQHERDEIEKRDEEVRRLRDRMGSDTDQQRSEVERLREHVKTVEQRLDQVVQSTSWRMTAPIRSLVQRIRGR